MLYHFSRNKYAIHSSLFLWLKMVYIILEIGEKMSIFMLICRTCEEKCRNGGPFVSKSIENTI